MSLWSSIKTGAKNFWNWVTGNDNDDDVYSTTVSDEVTPDSGKQTLNEKIKSGNLSTNNTTQTTTSADSASGFGNLKNYLETKEETPSVMDTATIAAETTTEEPPKEEEDYSFWEYLYSPKANKKLQNDINGWINKQIDSSKASAKYQEIEQLDAIGYDEDSGDVLYLDLNQDRGLGDADWGTRSGTEDMYNTYLSEFLLEANRTGATPEEQQKAWQNFYDKAKYLFRIRSDDYYNNGTFGKIKRRKEMYTEDELAMLAENRRHADDGDSTGKYTPTFDEFVDFVGMKMDNDANRREIYESYGLVTDEADEQQEFEIGGTFQSEWMENMRNIALNNIDSYLEPMSIVNPNAAQEALLTYSTQVLGDQLGRYFQRVQPVYKYEQEILGRDKSTWSEGDRELLETAAKFREMDKAFANGLNDWFRQVLLYGTDKNGDIVNSIDEFENGESLSDVLTKDMKKISGVDWALEEHQSALDIASKMANEASYQYMKDKVGWLHRKWNAVESWFDSAGHRLGETGQFVFGTSMDVVNSVVTGRDSLTSDYMDQDFTIGRLIETDDGNIKRTIKKYALEGAEYVPEVVGNLLPDVALAVATGGSSIGTLSRHLINVKRVYNIIKEAKGASLLSKTGALLKGIASTKNALAIGKNMGLSMEKLKVIAEGANKGRKISQTLKTGAQLADRFITDVGLGQIMDSQWSAYDTEPYSKASFLWSILPSVGFDAMPHLFRAATGKGWFKTLFGMEQGNIWSLAKYIDSSDTAAENVARALGKSAKDIDLDDLKLFAKNYSAIEEAAKQVYEKQLTAGERAAIGKMTKQLAYNYVNQAFGSNSITAKRIRAILANGSTNIADVMKYLGRIPGEVSMGPFVSTIKFKNGTQVLVSENPNAKGKVYSPIFDAIYDGGFDSRVKNGFTQADLDKMSKVEGYYSINNNKKKYFNKIEKDGEVKYYLNEEGLKRFGLKGEGLTMEALGVSLADAERVRGILKEKLGGVDGVKITPDTINAIADTGGYDEIVSKVKEVLGC